MFRQFLKDGVQTVDLVNVDVHTKFGQIVCMYSQDNERKLNSDVNLTRVFSGCLTHKGSDMAASQK